MATHHSRPKGTKGSNNEVVVPSWDNIWQSFSSEKQKTTIEEMNVDGWKTIRQASQETGLSLSRVNQLATGGQLERVKKKIFHGGITREVNFVRPLLTS